MLLNILADLLLYFKYLVSGDTSNLVRFKELKSLYKSFRPAKYRYLTKEKKITNLFLSRVYTFYSYINEFKPILDTTLFDQDEKKSQLYLNYFIETNLTDDIRNKREKFTKDSMWKKIIESENPTNTLKEIEEEFILYKNFLTKSNMPKIEQEYYLLYKLNMLSTFNFEYLFSKFDSDFIGTKSPNYIPINGDEILNELKDIYFLIGSLPPKIDLTHAFVKLIRNPDQNKAISKKAQTGIDKIYKMINDELSPQIILNMCKYISENTKLKIKIDTKELSILDKYKKEMENRFYKNKDYILEKYSEKSLQHDIKSLFSNITLLNINGATEELSNILEQNNIDPISGIQALRVTKTFIFEIYEMHIRDILNSVIVEGFYIEKDFQNDFSNKFFSANELKDYLLNMEESLSNSPKNSFSYLTTLLKSLNSKSVQSNMNKVIYLIEQINEKIKNVNEKCASVLYRIGADIFKIINDYKQQKPVYISNIKIIKGNQNKEFIQQLVNSYNDIAKYIKIIKNFVTIDVSK
ncbi:MAG: hypothetical protein JXB50_07165 [Spirochaetes bacterium]|nr:hypothetical protein [Spirochaetota bacterium]